MQVIVLPGSHRHAGDPVLAGLLSRARVGALTEEDHALLRSCIRPAPTDGQPVTYLYPHNVNVDAKNREALQKLPGEMHVFDALDEEGSPNGKKYPPKPGAKTWDPLSDCRALKRL